MPATLTGPVFTAAETDDILSDQPRAVGSQVSLMRCDTLASRSFRKPVMGCAHLPADTTGATSRSVYQTAAATYGSASVAATTASRVTARRIDDGSRCT